MAKVLNPLNSTEARGRIGGLVYGTWRGISYVRTLVTPANQSTPRRLALRALSAQCTHRWQLISDAQRTAWQHFANSHLRPDWTGTPRRPHGFNFFLACNVLRLDMGYTIVDAPPSIPNSHPLQTFIASADIDHIDVDWTLPPGAVGADLKVDIWITMPLSAGRVPKIQDAKHLAYVDAEDTAYATGELYDGSYGIFARSIREDSGLASPFVLATARIGAAGVLSQGPLYCHLGVDVPDTGAIWLNPENIYAADSSSAIVDFHEFTYADVLRATDFRFGIPAAATLLGITVDMLVQASLDFIGYFTFVYNSTPRGDAQFYTYIAPGWQWITVGGDDFLWEAAPLVTEVNSPLFGFDLWSEASDTLEAEVELDAIRATIWYST